MMITILFYVHYALLLIFGILTSAVFCGIRLNRKNILLLAAVFAVCGLAQVQSFYMFGEMTVWKIYPLITHLPLFLVLVFCFKKRVVTVFAAVSSAYLCCQPAKWIGLLVLSLTGSPELQMVFRILTLIGTGFLAIYYLSIYLSDIYNKDSRSVMIFGIIPMVYYFFDYSMSIYTDFWSSNNRAAIEFLPFFLCIVYMVFCVVYYKTYEQKADAERKEQMIRFTIDAMAKEIDTVKKIEREISLYRHDMRFLLHRISICIENGDMEGVQKMLAGYATTIESTAIHRYCSNPTINYILSDFAQRCREKQTINIMTVKAEPLDVDEVLFSSILSNALDNALNAQDGLTAGKRHIQVVLKADGKRLLLSVKNTFAETPVFVDGLPTTSRADHGFGVQSIHYMTERLGGTCQFTVENGYFVLRVVLPMRQQPQKTL